MSQKQQTSTDSIAGKITKAVGKPSGYLSLLVFLVALALPLFATNYILHILILVFITGIGAIAWNIIGGYGGQFALGNAVFYGFGAYSVALLVNNYGQSFFVALAVGIILSVLLAVLVGYPTFTLSGHYFALATIAVVEGMLYLVLFFGDFTGGAIGQSVTPASWLADLVGNRVIAFYIFFAIFGLCILISTWVRYSKLGYYLLAIREDQDAAAALGVNTTRYKIYGFALSAAMTALAGGMYAVYGTYVSPSGAFSLDLSIQYALITLIGGMGTIIGPIVGTLFMVPIQQYVTTVLGGNLGSLAYIGYGVILIVVIIYAPEGLVTRLSFVREWIDNTLPEVK
ncbi:branched-chain amino acid ABC transporter permease [Halobellus rarus]|uniref:Branched-chain amino acid ABC transporter permease n=1 Tax=Halobellus rarus TaxID=1126237 RepID=A0ABD6CQA4_9EURY|nr:branched-chain amino acid ABC transporter permease [Halobellus rarus]